METVISILAVLLTISAFLNVYLWDGLRLMNREASHLETELDGWRKNAVLRDQRTGRYVSKGKRT